MGWVLYQLTHPMGILSIVLQQARALLQSPDARCLDTPYFFRGNVAKSPSRFPDRGDF